MNSPQLCFLALEPDEQFGKRVIAYKRQVRQLVGDQLYLDHPPHLTLLVAAFPPGVDLSDAVAGVAAGATAPTVGTCGWHVFERDRLTGRNTLVCDVSPEGRRVLEEIQRRAVAAVAPLRDPVATRSRYDTAWQGLSEAERAGVEAFGFPFVGPAWHPHVTIASVRREDWHRVWPDLAADPPVATVCFHHLAVYRVADTRPVLVERFAFARLTSG